ncbi:MAG: glycoside hydrolase family 88 protein, partial [Chitinophagales bacterium]
MKKISSLFAIILFLLNTDAQTWVDSLSSFAHEKYLPAQKFKWTWVNAPLLRATVLQYEFSNGDAKNYYLSYIQKAMDNKAIRASGTRPNTVAPAHGFAFLAKVLGQDKYAKLAAKIYADYLKIPRTSVGGITHLARTPELWDDTMYMIGVFLLEMYRYSGDEIYLDELMQQFQIHREKLL